MNYEQVAVEQEGRVMMVSMNRPEKRNALSEKMTAELITALEEACADPDVGAVVLTGKGQAFCAGADLADFSGMAAKTAPVLHLEGAASTELFKMGQKMTKPLIAAVNGPAMGGGCGLVAMCHLAVASEKAKFGTPEIRVGIFPFVIFPLLARAVGPRRALEMALTGRSLDAAEAEATGLVHRVFAEADFQRKTLELATELAERSPLVMRLGLNAFYTSTDMEINKAFDYLNTLRVIDFLSEDLREGAMAFIQKRPPRWKGR
ncbi:enoyl-CoA hydratase/isomerase family protein [Desulfallas sp. Bu1-1]|uniref:enoyl-CoA hydratase/isomerase family protein n=1 Tax=Desulfallas sp. Bu1-1 TaxID=2787620 RepID=UPI00189D0840|nr:enoyl-CoA hydratase-related protein [Desulfallas sp. Bu1-1]MBF7082267.1 enoyl-CoA hydratase/isomerase family protein [Desulfallas sp. Bu1-1]